MLDIPRIFKKMCSFEELGILHIDIDILQKCIYQQLIFLIDITKRATATAGHWIPCMLERWGWMFGKHSGRQSALPELASCQPVWEVGASLRDMN